ncbi:hypothetical protein KHS38_02160 [Mucilaginibacter sp. Bleaf8]|uniref:hypothetical protein n=1 Tax=Mucilaginibacter sp. Bleaf8 TaxID=2834430 RepID=UPI001BCBCDFA|nr:hypothetical protein [Mucilaginibacter sp. Bleaf8]MBS7563197.1 hypothetical protein [Mucilaginibacter sp. Bleaf8]
MKIVHLNINSISKDTKKDIIVLFERQKRELKAVYNRFKAQATLPEAPFTGLIA